jgi:hypothetical protein
MASLRSGLAALKDLPPCGGLRRVLPLAVLEERFALGNNLSFYLVAKMQLCSSSQAVY